MSCCPPLLHAVTLRTDSVRFEIQRAGLARVLGESDVGIAARLAGVFDLVAPVQLKRRCVEAKLVMPAARGRSAPPDAKLVRLLADDHRWIDELAAGRAASVRDLARRTGRDAGEVSRTLPLAFLAPDIVEAILAGRQPIELTPRTLKRIGALPGRWHDQRRRLGVPP